ncbi:tRNA lysidine(34) synthetase TilS [Legionella jordanis]|uniref:tRNA(Ile)-lysidine synthase n=1 Tax=Legionella jordanis TaxID=456 RepID=A0A0W0VFL6_9GAMM|nr:tRNA lysidine(34) synthetase TilS [Legionella jordanis]KTD18940.1 cell cycle protein MesJ [Legionella jordanis]VEH13040.1 cell cycle protein MesJ [Legionella jordanis]
MIESLIDNQCRQSLLACERIYVGYSGGLDSTVLLHALSQDPNFLPKITAVHINHGLSPNAQGWEKHCQAFCKKLNLPLIIRAINLHKQGNVEEIARKARYEVFRDLVQENDCLLLAHHLNDQAETLLLHLFRGAGIDGLAAMPFCKSFAKGKLIRPLLFHSRATLNNYAGEMQLDWVEDESNENSDFSRNFIRHQIIPELRSRWPKVINNLTRTSEHCQQAQSNLDDLAKMDCPSLNDISTVLELNQLKKLNRARLTNVLRLWLKKNEVRLPSTATFTRLITELIEAASDANPQVSWPDISVRRYQNALYLIKKANPPLPLITPWPTFPEPLNLPGLGELKVKAAKKGLAIPAGSKIEIRFRQGGETLTWRKQTKELKKLFQQWQVPTWLRNRIPLLYINEQLACVVGYAISDSFFKDSQESFEIALL